MRNLIEINNVALGIKEYDNQRVITFKDIDRVHNRPDGTSRKAFTRNKIRFIEGEDYFLLTRGNPMSVSWTMGSIPPKGLTLITESGYYMIAKVFDDELAWQVQKQLINGYFRAKELSQDKSQSNIEVLNTLNNITTTLSSITDRLTKLEAQTTKPTLPIPKYSRWKSITFEKFKLLMNYVNDNSDQDLSLANTMNLVFKEVQDTYNVDFADYTYMYKCEFGIPEDEKVQTLDVINHYKDLKDMFNLTLDSILEKLHIQTEKNTSWNIFDELAAKIN